MIALLSIFLYEKFENGNKLFPKFVSDFRNVANHHSASPVSRQRSKSPCSDHLLTPWTNYKAVYITVFKLNACLVDVIVVIMIRIIITIKLDYVELKNKDIRI